MVMKDSRGECQLVIQEQAGNKVGNLSVHEMNVDNEE